MVNLNVYLFPIVMVGVTLLLCAAVFFVTKNKALFKNGSKKDNVQTGDILSPSQKTANEFVNVKDIQNSFLYTNDGLIMMYIKIQPVSFDLLSVTEQNNFIINMTSNLSPEKFPYKLLCLSRPFDISALLGNYSQMRQQTTDLIRRDLLRRDMEFLSENIVQGEVIERQFYFVIWQTYAPGSESEISKRANDMIHRFDKSSLRIADKQEIITLCNQINNQSFAFLDNTVDTDDNITILERQVR